MRAAGLFEAERQIAKRMEKILACLSKLLTALKDVGIILVTFFPMFSYGFLTGLNSVKYFLKGFHYVAF
jgi:hypothetical protein